MIVRTFDGFQSLTTPTGPTWSGGSSHALTLYGLNQAYAQIYRTQPNVRICVDFLARNIAHVAPLAYRRVSDTDRVRLPTHDLVTWLGKPNPATGRYRLIESLMGDLGIYFNAYWLKARYRVDGRAAIGLVRLPPEQMEVKGGLLPSHFCWTANGRTKEFPTSEIVYFNGYNPLDPLAGLSPLETLRRVLAEEAAAGEHREGFWRNASRHEGVVTRPATAKRYTEAQMLSWREQWQAAHAGGAGAGKTVLLQDGETFTTTSFSAKESEYTVGGKLRREICAAEYHIPLPFVGILDHATFSNIKEQHRNLYQDCLGPWFEMIRQELHRQLLVECEDATDVYVEFNIDSKLAGTPEERADSIHQSTGRPWRTVNEARALENLPRLDDPDLDTVAPQQGGPSDATAKPHAPAADRVARVLHHAHTRQQARLQKHPPDERAAAFFAHQDRYTRELVADLTPIIGADALRVATQATVTTMTELLALEEDAA